MQTFYVLQSKQTLQSLPFSYKKSIKFQERVPFSPKIYRKPFEEFNYFSEQNSCLRGDNFWMFSPEKGGFFL